MSATGQAFSEAFMDAIAERVVEKLLERMPSTGFGGKRLLTIKEAAQMIGRTPDAVYQLVNRKRIPSIKDGRRVHIDRKDLEMWIEQGRKEG